MRKRKSTEAIQLPGPAPVAQADITDFIIILKEDGEPAVASKGRRAVYMTGHARTDAFIRRLRHFLKSHTFEDQVVSIGAPTAFPLVAIRCTPAVAKALKEMPGVEDVVRDAGNISLVRSNSD